MTKILGMSMSTFTSLHVAISLIALVTGPIVIIGMIRARVLHGWTPIFLVATGATSITGFLFHSAFGPADVIGIISLVALAVTVYALYPHRFTGPWRWIYVVGSVLVLYFNAFVAVVQAFQKLSGLQPLSSGPVFAGAQALVAAGFIAAGILAVRGFRPAAGRPE